MFYEKIGQKEIKTIENSKNIDNSLVQCKTCSRECIVKENSYGFCYRRKNINGKLYYINYNNFSAQSIDPIEKKPLYHFLPNSLSYSIGGYGCNMSCLNCQNHSISQIKNEYNIINNDSINNDSINNNTINNNNSINNFMNIKNTMNDETNIENENNTYVKLESIGNKIVKNAINNNCKSISFTYNEPTIHIEEYIQIAKIAQNNGLKTIFVSNGYMSNESLKYILKNVDAFNIDLKAYSNEFYKNICNAKLDIVLKNIKKIYKEKKHIEITNLLINNLNDFNEMIKSLVDFILNNLNDEVPLHFSRAFPNYKMNNIKPTKLETLKKAKKIAIDSGLENVYLGNMPIKY
ncbi:MAG: radical SAM protein [Methanobrevibacter sp.]|nr:radical SAM protein [Candidatus Methanoflexus mossambicus]